jgi:hypothetical protein
VGGGGRKRGVKRGRQEGEKVSAPSAYAPPPQQHYSLMPALGPLKKTLPVTVALPVMAW